MHRQSVTESVHYTKASLGLSKGTCIFLYKKFSFGIVFAQTCITIDSSVTHSTKTQPR